MSAIPEDSREGKGILSNQVFRDLATIVGVLLSIEAGGVLYSIYILGLYKDGRWSWYIALDVLLFIAVMAVGAFLGVRWGKDVNVFGELVRAGEPTTVEQAKKAAKAIFEWPKKAAIFYCLAYSAAFILCLAVLTRLGHISARESGGLIAFKLIAIFSMSVIVYSACKMVERPMLGEAVARLFAGRVYSWPHSRIEIRYKIFGVLAMVAAYLMCGSVLMGFSQARRARAAQLESDLTFWLGQAEESLKRRGQKPDFSGLPDKIGSSSNLVAVSSSGEILAGDVWALTPDELEMIVTSDAKGPVIDNKNGRVIILGDPLESGHRLAAVGKLEAGGLSARVRNDLIALLLASLLLLAAATYILVNDINGPLQNVLEFLRAIADNETGKNLRAYSEDEMGDFARELARTTDLLRDRNRSIELLHHIEALSESIEINCSFTKSAVEEQAAGALEQGEAVHDALQISAELAITAGSISKNANSLLRDAEENLSFCTESRERLTRVLEDLRSMADFVHELSDVVVYLGRNIGDVTLGMEMIEEINEQLNLLAFNAQLEAAGAGEAGSRFMVVAEETARLCRRAFVSAEAIGEMIEQTRDAMERAAETSMKGIEIVTKNEAMIDEITATIVEIDGRARDSEETARGIAAITAQQEAACGEMNETIEGLSAAAAQIKSNADNVLSAITKLATMTVQLEKELNVANRDGAQKRTIN